MASYFQDDTREKETIRLFKLFKDQEDIHACTSATVHENVVRVVIPVPCGYNNPHYYFQGRGAPVWMPS